jgi:hypothetical protein
MTACLTLGDAPGRDRLPDLAKAIDKARAKAQDIGLLDDGGDE